MKKLLATNLIFLISITCFAYVERIDSGKSIKVEINKNVELLGFAYFLVFEGKDLENSNEIVAVNGEQISEKDWYSYGFEFYQKYKSFSENKNLAKAFEIADHLWLDYIISLLVQLDDFPNAILSENIEENYFIRFSKREDMKEAKENVAAFLDGLNQFYAEVDFDSYLSASEVYYDNVRKQVEERLPADNFIPTMEKFYQKEFDSYTLIPSLTIPTGMGFGIRYSSAGKMKIYNVFGALALQSFKDKSQLLDMGFGNEDRLRELSTHEFGHSFVNPVIDQIPRELIDESEKLFDPIKNDMTGQNYGNWKSCLYEHFVRAGEVIIARNLGNTEDAENLKKWYIEGRKFIYLPIIIEELEDYNKSQKITYKQAVKDTMKKLITVANKNAADKPGDG